MFYNTVEEKKSEEEKINDKIQAHYETLSKETEKVNTRHKTINEWSSYCGTIHSLPVIGVEVGEYATPRYKEVQNIIFEFSDEYNVFVAPRQLPESIRFGSIVDLMIVGTVENYGQDGYREKLGAIVSTIKMEDKKRWEEILKNFNEHLPIDARIENINGEGINFDIGCGIKTFCKTSFIHNKKANDIIKVIVKSIFEESCEKTFNVQVQLYNLNEEKKEYIKKMMTDTFILDTNVLIDFPELLLLLIEIKKKPIIVYNVLEELDGLKNSENKETRKKVYRSLELINENINTVVFASPNFKYLPEGLDKNKNDNKIIAVAIENKEQKPVIFSNDIGIIIKSKSQGIEVLNYAKEML